jgi:hypothetical protein
MRQDDDVTDDTDAVDDLSDFTSEQGQPHDRDADGQDDRLEMLLTGVFALAAASVARKVAGELWKATTGRTPPSGGKDERANLKVIILWGAMAGAAAGVARAVAERQAVKVAHSRRSS